ncbi:MAG TPA: TonB-dependent receptor plug domain-containing protein, partial [Novosphingobium sp.]|nr:TonB-dependent receptor plug domain-containing protein [Novosphingobium sp.]
MRAPLYLLSSIALSALLLPALARAEAPAPTPAPANGLGEIIVTAQHRSESLQKAAVSVTAVSGDLLRASASNSAAAAIANVAAVQIQGNTNGAQIYIRGVGSNADSQLGDPAVNLNVDGVYQQETEVPTSLIFDVNRVEVLRGPQGTLYGRNATAGAVNIVTTDPEPGKLGGYAMLQGGNYAAIHSEAALNLPISADWTARAAFASDKHD